MTPKCLNYSCASPLRARQRPAGRQRASFNPDKGFSGCGLETIAGLKVELGLERVDLAGGDGRDDVNEGVDDGSMLGQIEGREGDRVARIGCNSAFSQACRTMFGLWRTGRRRTWPVVGSNNVRILIVPSRWYSWGWQKMVPGHGRK